MFACLIFAPGFLLIIKSTPPGTLLTVFLLGALYGVGNLSFGLALRYLGLSLGYALSLGLMLAIGTLIPPAIDGRLHVMMLGKGGTLPILGIVIAGFGIALSAWSGILKDKIMTDAKKKESIGEFDLIKGAMAAVLVGFTGSAMSLGFEQGNSIGEIAAKQGVDPLFTMMPLFVILFAGTFITTIGWCLYLGMKNQMKNQLKR